MTDNKSVNTRESNKASEALNSECWARKSSYISGSLIVIQDIYGSYKVIDINEMLEKTRHVKLSSHVLRC